MRFYPESDLLLKDLIEKEARDSLSQALLLSDKARLQAQSIKRRAMFRRAGLKTPEEDMYTSSLKRDQLRSYGHANNNQNILANSPNPFSTSDEFTFGLSSYPHHKVKMAREKTSMDGILTGRYSRTQEHGAEKNVGGSSESLDKYNSLLAGNKENDQFENPNFLGNYNSLSNKNSKNASNKKRSTKYHPSVSLNLNPNLMTANNSNPSGRSSNKDTPEPPKELFKMKKFSNIKSRTDHSWS